MSKEEWRKYIKHFDTVFDTKVMESIDENKLILFLEIYEKMKEDLYTPTKEYLSLQKEKLEVLENLSNTFTDEQKDKFNHFLELDITTKEQNNEQIIIFEFILLNLMTVSKNINRSKNNV